MNPKNKAKSLVKKFRKYSFVTDFDYESNGAKDDNHNAIKCALIAIDEIIKNPYTFKFLSQKDYWTEVKNEIKKL
jgi:predicted nuclease of restriction endonuclease-like (RecB) superfamily